MITKEEWFGFALNRFEFEGREALVVEPKRADEEKNWAIYTEYFGAFPNTAIALLEKGFHLAYLQNQNRWGIDSDQEARHRFHDYLTANFGFSSKCVPIGMSCGGLHAINYASLFPEDISVLYLDAAVVNLLSCPMGFGKGEKDENVIAECLAAVGMTQSELICYRRHPLDRLLVLADHKIPVVMLYGEEDVTVPYEENGIFLEKLYKEKELPLLVIGKPGCGHHPHGLEDPAPIVDFILQYTGREK